MIMLIMLLKFQGLQGCKRQFNKVVQDFGTQQYLLTLWICTYIYNEIAQRGLPSCGELGGVRVLGNLDNWARSLGRPGSNSLGSTGQRLEPARAAASCLGPLQPPRAAAGLTWDRAGSTRVGLKGLADSESLGKLGKLGGRSQVDLGSSRLDPRGLERPG